MAEPHDYAPVGLYLCVHDGYAALAFYKRAFGAEVREEYAWEGKLGHATLTLNGGELMLSDEFGGAATGTRSPKALGGTTANVALAVDDADGWFERAVEAGCEVVRPLKDEFYGRGGKVRDPFGHVWSITGPTRGTPS